MILKLSIEIIKLLTGHNKGVMEVVEIGSADIESAERQWQRSAG